MELAKQYLQQAQWRCWSEMLSCVPMLENDIVLDIGAGPGTVSNLLANHVAQVIGIERNKELIDVATRKCSDNVSFVQCDVRNLDNLNLPLVQGIWSSFTAAYFVDFFTVVQQWLTHLAIGGWCALIEVSNLFAGHSPLSAETASAMARFSEHLRKTGMYDCNMGNNLEVILRTCGLIQLKRFEFKDKELSFQGPASLEVFDAWKQRLERLSEFPLFLGKDLARQVSQEFLDCLLRDDHACTSKVIMVVGRHAKIT